MKLCRGEISYIGSKGEVLHNTCLSEIHSCRNCGNTGCTNERCPRKSFRAEISSDKKLVSVVCMRCGTRAAAG